MGLNSVNRIHLFAMKRFFCFYFKTEIKEVHNPYYGLMYFVQWSLCITIVFNGKAVYTKTGPRLPNLNEVRE